MCPHLLHYYRAGKVANRRGTGGHRSCLEMRHEDKEFRLTMAENVTVSMLQARKYDGWVYSLLPCEVFVTTMVWVPSAVSTVKRDENSEEKHYLILSNLPYVFSHSQFSIWFLSVWMKMGVERSKKGRREKYVIFSSLLAYVLSFITYSSVPRLVWLEI